MSENVDLDCPHILIFDSGVGGLSILDELQRLIPNAQFSYVSDNAGFPYGNKPTDFIINRVNEVIQASIKHIETSIDIIIIACNTASTIALPSLRQSLLIPVVGVVPAIKPAAERSKNQYIGLLATPATIQRAYTRTLITEHAQNCHVVSVGSTRLVEIAEQKLETNIACPEQIANILLPFQKMSKINPTPDKLDYLILACTHFPLLAAEIQNILSAKITLIDSAKAIAKRTLNLLQTAKVKSNCEKLESQFFFTQRNENIQALQPALKKFSLQTCKYLQV